MAIEICIQSYDVGFNLNLLSQQLLIVKNKIAVMKFQHMQHRN